MSMTMTMSMGRRADIDLGVTSGGCELLLVGSVQQSPLLNGWIDGACRVSVVTSTPILGVANSAKELENTRVSWRGAMASRTTAPGDADKCR